MTQLQDGIGINFRATSGYVTDGTNETYCRADDTYPTTRLGVTFGWEDAIGVSNDRDRDSGADPRLAGINYHANDSSSKRFRVDLDTATDHDIRAAFGDHSSNQRQHCEYYDNVTSFAGPYTNRVTPVEDWLDANDVIRDGETAWINDNVKITRTFGSTILRVHIATGTAAVATSISHLFIQEVGGGGGATVARQLVNAIEHGNPAHSPASLNGLLV